MRSSLSLGSLNVTWSKLSRNRKGSELYEVPLYCFMCSLLIERKVYKLFYIIDFYVIITKCRQILRFCMLKTGIKRFKWEKFVVHIIEMQLVEKIIGPLGCTLYAKFGLS